MSSRLRWKVAQFAELRWWQNYLKKKDKATYYNWKKKYWNDLVIKIQDDLIVSNDSKILDAGCGPAGIFINYPDHSITAIDPLLDDYTNRLPFFEFSDFPKVNFINSSIEAFNIDEKFDVIFCMNAINHVVDIDKCWDVLLNHLKPNGQLVVTIDAHNHPIFRKLFAAIPGDVLHPHQYNLEEYIKMLTDRGLSLTRNVKLKSEFFFDHHLLVMRECENRMLECLNA